MNLPSNGNPEQTFDGATSGMDSAPMRRQGPAGGSSQATRARKTPRAPDAAKNENWLVTFPPSIDSETSRWIIDHHGTRYEERRHALPFVALVCTWYKAALPALKLNGRIVSGPRPISEHFDAAPTPVEQRLSLTGANAAAMTDHAWQRYNIDLGLATARWAYFYLLEQREPALSLVTEGAPTLELWFNRLAFPLVTWGLGKGLKLGPTQTREALSTIEAVFDEADRDLADGRRYLAGDRFSIADLTFAVAGAPVVLPPEYGGPLPRFEQLPDVMQPIVRQFAARPAGKHILRMYAEHRRR